jgi:hypothetical protein
MATVEGLRRKVQSLASKIVEMQGNIVEFHMYVTGVQNDFAAYNVTCDDLPINLFWAYQEVDDELFVRLAERMHDKWITTPTMPIINFMNKAENECNMRIQMGTWKAPTRKDLGLMAMKATVEKFEKAAVSKKKEIANVSNNTPRKSYVERLKEEKKTSPWKFKAPEKGEAWSKKMENQTYHWCSKQVKWVTTHKDNECLGVNASPTEYNSNKKKGKKNNGRNVAFK